MTARVRESDSSLSADRPKRPANKLLRIMKHEWRNLSADRTVWVVAVLFALIIGYGIYNGAAWAAFQKKTIDSSAAEEQERLAKLRDDVIEIGAGRKQPAPFSDPTLPATVGNNLGQRYAAMPPAPLAALSVGQSDLQSYYFKVSTRSKRNFITNDEIENPTNLMSGRFDLAFVVIYLYPLLILALSYNLISGEREQGTLAMLLAQPVSLRTFVLGKVGLRATVILAMAIIFTLLGIALGGIDLSGEGVVLRLAIWAGVVIAYGAFWFALAIAIGALGKSSATNAVALAGLWLALVVLVPSLVNITATTAYPVPSRVEMMNAAREASNAATAEGSKLLAKYYEDHPELAADAQPDMNDFAARSYAVQEAVERSIQPVMARYDEQLAEQQKLVNRFRYASPAILVLGALNDIAGTGPDRYRHFLSQVDSFHSQWQAFFIPKVFQKARLTEDDYDALPRFAYVEEPAGAVAGRVTVPLLILSLAALVIGLLAMPVLGRYPLND